MKKMFIMLVLGITLLNTRIYIEDYDISHFKENEICVSIFNKDIFPKLAIFSKGVLYSEIKTSYFNLRTQLSNSL